MDKFNDNVLFKTKQHKVVLFLKFLRIFLGFWLPISIIIFFISWYNIIVKISSIVFLAIICFAWVYFFWNRSFLIITNKKIAMEIRNGIFSNYHMNIYFKNIRDLAYSKNNILHYIFNCWSFFARSSAWAWGDFEAFFIPKVEKVYKIVNNLYLLSEEKREILDKISSLDNIDLKNTKKETFDEIIEKEKNILLWIQWIKEVYLLSDKDRTFIFENEEDRNHWVYESLRKKILFVISHDSSFREPDESIVYKKWEKVIFPIVKFHEIERKWVVSSSPWLKIHNYLKDKFKNLDEYDATILVGFDI